MLSNIASSCAFEWTESVGRNDDEDIEDDKDDEVEVECTVVGFGRTTDMNYMKTNWTFLCDCGSRGALPATT